MSPGADKGPSALFKNFDLDQLNQVVTNSYVLVHSLLADHTDCFRLEGNGFSPPLGYRTPPWPSLYWPFDAAPNVPQYLYYATGIPCRKTTTEGRHLEVHTILDIYDFWSGISGGRAMGMECLLSQN